jgi:hypothetical protein
MKYKVGDLFYIPHFNGHNEPGYFVIVAWLEKDQKYKVLYETLEQWCNCSHQYLVDIEHCVLHGEYIHYPFDERDKILKPSSKTKYSVGDLIGYQSFMAVVVDIPDKDILEIEWINAPSNYDEFIFTHMVVKLSD